MTTLPRPLGKYELLAKIGDGGMATVHRGRLTAAGGAVRQVALKLIHPHLNRERSFLEMFFDEMRVAMALTHRNIVQTFDAGEQDGQHFLVMELIDGCSLRALIDDLGGQSTPMPVDIALFVAMELCAALDYAHHFDSGGGLGGVVHRDISPSNVLLSEQGDVKLADFGVARAFGHLSVSSADLVKGKLSYMAPEQARGQVEPRSDLFSLGAVLFEMLGGRPLRPQATLQLVREGQTISTAVSTLRPGVPGELDQLLRHCLAPQPQARPATAFELRERLAQIFELLERQTGPARDPHARLRIFLAERLDRIRQARPPTGPDPRAAHLARAMMQQALEVPTDVGSTPSVTAKPSPPGKTVPELAPGKTVPELAPGKTVPELAPGDTVPELPLDSLDTAERTATSPRVIAARPARLPIAEEASSPGDTAVTLTEHPALAPITSLSSISAMVRDPRHRRRLLLGLILGGLTAVGIAVLVALVVADDPPASAPRPVAPAESTPPQVRLVEVLPSEGAERDDADEDPATAATAATPVTVATDDALRLARPATPSAAKRPRPRVSVPPAPPPTAGAETSDDERAAHEPATTRRDRAAAPRPRDRPDEGEDQTPAQPGLRPDRPGRLDINAVPWARVYVDGQFRGETPVQNLMLRPGRHRLRLVNPKRGLSRELVVRIRPGERLKKVIRLH
jgi:serine/threonine-protein kinase